MRKTTLKIIGATAAVLIALYFVLPHAYARLFPQRVLEQQTLIRFIFLGAAASETHRFQGEWPAHIQQLVAQPDLYGNMAMFLKSGTNDAWGRPIIFEAFDLVRGYGRIISYGADGQPGGRDIILHYGENQKMAFAKKE